MPHSGTPLRTGCPALPVRATSRWNAPGRAPGRPERQALRPIVGIKTALPLPPRQSHGLPASRHPTMPCGIDTPLEPIGDVVNMRKARRLRRLRRCETALAAATDEVNAVLRSEAGLLQLVRKGRIGRHGRIDLPLDRHHLLAGR